MKNLECIVDGAHGVFVPMVFAQTVSRALLSGVTVETLDYLAKEESVEDDGFWDAWGSVLNNARITHNGKIYHLHQDGDLFAIDWVNLTDEEMMSFGLGD